MCASRLFKSNKQGSSMVARVGIAPAQVKLLVV